MATEKLSVLFDPRVRDELETWAEEEDRPIANLLRRIVSRALAERQRSQAGGARAA
jgi:hypothetical protein